MKTSLPRRLRRASAPVVEPLECRISPASVVSVAGGNLSVIDNVSGNDNITLSFSANNFHFFDPGGMIAGAGAIQVDGSHVDVPQSTVTGLVLIDTKTGNDFVKLSPGLPPFPALTIHTSTLGPLPDLQVSTGSLDIMATGGDIAVMGQVTAGSVIFQAGGSITTQATGGIAAGNLDVHAVTGITINFNATTLSASNANTGGIVLNTAGSVSLTALDPGTGSVTLNGGSYSLASSGVFAGAPNVNLGAALDVNGFNVSLGALAGSGSITNSSPVTAGLQIGGSNGSGVFSGSISGNLAVSKVGSGTEVFSGPQNYPSLTTNMGIMTLLTPLQNANIANVSGVLNLAGGDVGSAVDVEAVTNFGGTETLASLTIGAGGLATLTAHPAGGNAFVLDVGSLTFTNPSSGQLDLTNNAMIVHGGDIAAITSRLTSGFAASTGGYWNGPGINSSAAASDPQQITALGVADNADFGYTNFGGIPLAGTGHDILIRFTYYGDANLSGGVDGVDYALAYNGLNNPGVTGWEHGDFDYNGTVNATDLATLDSAKAQQAGGPGSPVHVWTGAASNDWFDPTNWTNGVPGAADTAVLASPGGVQPQLLTTATVAFFDQSDGTLSGAGVLNVLQGMTWLGGNEVGGTTALAASASLTLGGANAKLLDSRTLDLPIATSSNNAGPLLLDNNATLQASAPLSLSLHLVLAPGGGVFDTNGFSVAFDAASIVDGPGGLTKIGAGTLVLGGSNLYAGPTAISAGTLAVNASNQLSLGSTLTVNGGTLALGSFDQSVAGVTLSAGSITGPGKLSTAAAISITGGNETADLSATSIVISGGVINANVDAAAGSITLSAGSFSPRSSNSINSALNMSGGSLNLGAFTETVGSATISGGTVTSTNGTLHALATIDASNTAITANLLGEGGITVSSGTVNGNLDAKDSIIALSGGTVTYTSSVVTNSGLVVSGGNLVLGATSPVFNNVAVNAGSVTATTGTLTTTHALVVNGGTVNANINAGTDVITLAGGVVTPNTNLNIASLLTVAGGTLVLGTKTASLGGLTYNGGTITGTGTIISATDYALQSGTISVKLAGNVGVNVGPGAVVLTNAGSSFIGTVTINSGSLQIASDKALGSPANAVDIESGGTLITTASITSARHIIANGATPSINVTAGTVTLNGVIDGTGTLMKNGPGNLLFGNAFVGTTTVSAGGGTISVGVEKLKIAGVGAVTLTVVSDGMGGTRISTIELAGTDATTVLAISGPKAPGTTTIDTIKSLNPNDEIGTIKLGPTVILGSGVNDAIPDVDIHGKVDKLLVNDVNSYTLFELGKGLPYNNIADDTTPDSYNNHPDIKLRNVLGTGVTIDVTGNGIAGDQPGSVGGGGLGKVVANSWTQPGVVETSQSIGSFQFRHGNCNVVFLVDPNHLGALTVAGIGKMQVPNGAWGSSGSIVEGNVTLFSAAQFLAAADITAGSMTKLVVTKGPYLGTTTLKNPDAPALGTFSVNGDYTGYVDSAQSMININIKGTFMGSLKAKSIGSISAYSFNGTTTGDGEGDPLRHNIFVTDGSLGTIKTSAGGIKDFEIAAATLFNGFNINWPTAPTGAVGISNVTVAAGQIGKITANLDLGVADPASFGIKDSTFESAAAIGTITSSHSVSGSIFAAATTMGNVVIKADLLDSKLLAGTSLGGDGVFNGNEVYTRAGKIGNVTATGEFATTTIAVGVDPGAGFIYGDGDDIAAPGFPTPTAIGALVFGAASGSVFGPAGMIHTDAIEAASIKSLKVGTNPVLKTFASSQYIRLGGSEVASDVLVQIV